MRATDENRPAFLGFHAALGEMRAAVISSFSKRGRSHSQSRQGEACRHGSGSRGTHQEYHP